MSLLISKQDFEELRQFLVVSCGIQLGEGSYHRVNHRLAPLWRELQAPSFNKLLKRLGPEQDPKLRARVINAVTHIESAWFRDSYPFEILKNDILPHLVQQKASQMRIWSAASATGQEPYSISMAIQEFHLEHPAILTRDIEIIATDVSEQMLSEASNGVYEKEWLHGLSNKRLNLFFTHRGEVWEVKPEIRHRVAFREADLTKPFSFLGKFDVVFCRNALIYFSEKQKADILRRIAQSMNPGGYLFLGGAESPCRLCTSFEMTRTPHGVAYLFKG